MLDGAKHQLVGKVMEDEGDQIRGDGLEDRVLRHMTWVEICPSLASLEGGVADGRAVVVPGHQLVHAKGCLPGVRTMTDRQACTHRLHNVDLVFLHLEALRKVHDAQSPTDNLTLGALEQRVRCGVQSLLQRE